MNRPNQTASRFLNVALNDRLLARSMAHGLFHVRPFRPGAGGALSGRLLGRYHLFMAPLLFNRTINYWAFPLLQLEFVLPFFGFDAQHLQQNLAPQVRQTTFIRNLTSLQQTLFNIIVAGRPHAEKSEQRPRMVTVSRETTHFLPADPAASQRIFASRSWFSSVFVTAAQRPEYGPEQPCINFHPLAHSSKFFAPQQQIFKASTGSLVAGRGFAPQHESLPARRFLAHSLSGHERETRGDYFLLPASLLLTAQNDPADQHVRERAGNTSAPYNFGVSPAVMRRRWPYGFLPAQIQLAPQPQAVAPVRLAIRESEERKQRLRLGSEVEQVTPSPAGVIAQGKIAIHASRHEAELLFHHVNSPIKMAFAQARPVFSRFEASHARTRKAMVQDRREATEGSSQIPTAKDSANREQAFYAAPVWLAPLRSRVAGPSLSRWQLPQNQNAMAEIFFPMSLHEVGHGGRKRPRASESGWQVEDTPALTHRMEVKQEASRAGESATGFTDQALASARHNEAAAPTPFSQASQSIRFGKVAGLAEPLRLNGNLPAEVTRIVEEVYTLLEKKLRTERERRGLFA